MIKIISLIFSRECKVRMRKRSYIIMTILGPLLLAGFVIIPMFLKKLEKNSIKHIAIIDETAVLSSTIKDFENYRFSVIEDMEFEEFRKVFTQSGYDALVFIPRNIYYSNSCVIYSHVWIDNALKAYIGYVLRRDLEYMALLKEKVQVETIKKISTPIFVSVQKWDKHGEYVDEEISMAKKGNLAAIAAMLIYMFIFMYGVMVLKGVTEEKSGRVVEILISSVKPYQLMAGKILGIGCIGLIQFLIWVMLTLGIVWGAQVILFPETYNISALPEMQDYIHAQTNTYTQLQSEQTPQEYAINLFEAIEGINWFVMISSFIFFFIFGFILYAAIFASIGAIVDAESDSQQFTIPVTLPLLIPILLLGSIVANPHGGIATILSFIPFTAPIALMARLPFGIPYWHIVISVLILLASCVGVLILSARLYKAGLLLYGKKVRFKTIVQLLRS